MGVERPARQEKAEGSLLKKSQQRPTIKVTLGVYGAVIWKTDKFVSCVMTSVRWPFRDIDTLCVMAKKQISERLLTV